MGAHSYRGPRHAKPRGPRHAKPAPPTAAGRTVAATGVAVAVITGETVGAGAASAVGSDTWAALRMCESSGNYHINTGNGYYGAYQFDLPTWRGLGYSGLPSDAPPAVQDEAARRLYAQRGWQPWPACSRKLGLIDDRVASRSAPRSPVPSATPVEAVDHAVPARSVRSSTVTPTSLPSVPWDGHYLSVRDIWQVRQDARLLQMALVARGYRIAIDGRYGPQTAAATTAFERANHLHVEVPAVAGPQVWGALFGR
ncbi:MAG: transglycosylase family protein [Acidothermus sp.]|nr:transglycosylase family protein [Acidothermus sp.]